MKIWIGNLYDLDSYEGELTFQTFTATSDLAKREIIKELREREICGWLDNETSGEPRPERTDAELITAFEDMNFELDIREVDVVEV